MLDQRTQPPAKAIKQIEVYTMQAGHMIQKVVTLILCAKDVQSSFLPLVISQRGKVLCLHMCTSVSN
jgi:hypothetical protein